MVYPAIKKLDKKLWGFVSSEEQRQQETLELIPSENFSSPAVREASGSRLTDKYAEGYPGKRYYPGNQYMDEIERHAQELALDAFKLDPAIWHVNVQPYSGSPANLAAYFALMEPGEVLLGMKLAHGGHLTHGHAVSVTGKIFKSVQYGLDSTTERVDFGEVSRLAKEHNPTVIVSGFTAYPRIVEFARFREIADSVGAYHLADIAHIAGLVAAGVHPSPFPHADVVTMTTQKSLRGPRAGIVFVRKDKTRAITSATHDGKTESKSMSLADLVDRAVFPGLQGGPHMHTIAAIAVMFAEAKKSSFVSYQKQVVKNAKVLAEALGRAGLRLVSGGTDNHLLLVDLKAKNMSGSDAEVILEKAGIIANRNAVPGDASPFRPSGIRLGTPAVTSRGMKEKEMRQIADFITRLLAKKEDPIKIRKEVIILTKHFPLP